MRRAGMLSGCSGVVFAFASCLVLLTATPAAAEWHRVDSPNFVVIGEADPGALRDVAGRFEAFRQALTLLLGERATASAVPTIVVMFPSDRAFTPFKPHYRGKAIALGGIFVPGTDVNYIGIVGDGDTASLRLVFHEYAHLVFANAARQMPVWLNEGLAEYYSTVELDRDGTRATMGRPLGDHLDILKRGPLFRVDALVRIQHGSPIYNEGDHRSIFYAQSWALTHLILHGEPRRTHLLHAYLNALWAGVPALDAWRQTFGDEQMDRELVSYVKRNVFRAHRFTFHEPLATFDLAAVPLPPADVEAFLADLLLQQERTDEAASRLARAGETGAAGAWLSTVTALIDVAQQNFASAERRLLALDSDNDWLTSYRAGVGLSNLIVSRGSAPAGDHVDAVRRLFAAAGSERRELPHAAASLARIELEGSDPPSGEMRAALEQASRSAPGRLDYVFLHARLLARQSAFVAARHLLAPLMAPGFPRDVRDAARRLMGDIVTVEAAAGRHEPVALFGGGRDVCCSSDRRPHSSLHVSRDRPEDWSPHVRLSTVFQTTLCER